ncbi:hypothetical protein ACU4GD_14880 [Cupriavidus basilensis]
MTRLVAERRAPMERCSRICLCDACGEVLGIVGPSASGNRRWRASLVGCVAGAVGDARPGWCQRIPVREQGDELGASVGYPPQDIESVFAEPWRKTSPALARWIRSQWWRCRPGLAGAHELILQRPAR